MVIKSLNSYLKPGKNRINVFLLLTMFICRKTLKQEPSKSYRADTNCDGQTDEQHTQAKSLSPHLLRKLHLWQKYSS